MYYDSNIVTEYVACTAGETFIVFSKNILDDENKIKIDNVEKEGGPLKESNNYAYETILLFLHGLNGNCFQFKNVFSALNRCNFKFISLDFYGHGRSSSLSHLTKYTEKLYTEQVYDVLKKKNIIDAKFILVGFSMGSIIAVHLSVDKKIKSEKFCLISAAGLARPKHRFLHFLLKHNIRLCLKMGKRYSYLLVSENFIKDEYFNADMNKEEIQKRYLLLKENHEKFLETFLKVLSGSNIQNSKKLYSTFLKENHEVLFIYGRDDKVTPYNYTVNFLKKHEKFLNDVKVVIFPNCSHLVLSEKHFDVIKHLLYFLQ